MDLIQRAATFFSDKRDASLSLAVSYSNGTETIQVQGTYAENQRTTEDVTTQIQSVETVHDFLFKRDDLQFGGSVHEPTKGDVITATIRGAARTFAVLGLPGIPVNENPDPYGFDIRVHTQEIT